MEMVVNNEPEETKHQFERVLDKVDIMISDCFDGIVGEDFTSEIEHCQTLAEVKKVAARQAAKIDWFEGVFIDSDPDIEMSDATDEMKDAYMKEVHRCFFYHSEIHWQIESPFGIVEALRTELLRIEVKTRSVLEALHIDPSEFLESNRQTDKILKEASNKLAAIKLKVVPIHKT